MNSTGVVKGKPGRPTKLETILKDKGQLIPLQTNCIEVIKDALAKKDKTVAMWCWEQIHGKAKQAIESKNTLELTISPDFQELLRARQRDLIEEQQQFLTDGEFHEVKD